MSRCFPFPPPGYARKGARVEAALIESIKLQSERANSKSDRKKEKSRDKKHKSKEHKGKSRHSSDTKVGKDNDFGREKEKSRKKLKNLEKVIQEEVEPIEKSDLTEEHGQPVCPRSPGYLSDGEQSSHKRKRVLSLPNEGREPGRIIRIKFTSRKKQEHDHDPSVPTEQTCSTSGCEVVVEQKRAENGPSPFQNELCYNNRGTVAIQDETSRTTIEGPYVDHIPLYGSKNYVKSAYETLFETWVPPTTQWEQVEGDEEWLFGTRRPAGHDTKSKQAIGHVPSCRSSSSLWPTAQYLPEADVYSLPYTIPF